MANDPRLDEPVTSANDKILDSVIRRGVYINGYTNGEAKKVVRAMEEDFLPSLKDELTIRLSKIEELGYDRGSKTTKKIESLLAYTEKTINAYYDNLYGQMQLPFEEFGMQDAEWQAKSIQDATGYTIVDGKRKYDLNFIIPSTDQIKKAVLYNPFDGKNAQEWFSSISTSTQDKISKYVKQGIFQGDSPSKIVRAVNQNVLQGSTKRQTEAIVRTALKNSSSQAREEMFKKNQNVLKGYKAVVTLDTKTCSRCGALDGKFYGLEDPRPSYPLHMNCRCEYVPVVKSAKSLGLGTRASMNGQIPQDMTYNQWLKKQSVEVQNAALGEKRAIMFRKGEVDITSFDSKYGKHYTLDELKKAI